MNTKVNLQRLSLSYMKAIDRVGPAYKKVVQVPPTLREHTKFMPPPTMTERDVVRGRALL